MKQIIGKLFQKPGDPEPQQRVPMLALSISAGTVKATVWELQDHTVEILGLGTKVYSDSGKEKEIDYKNILEKAADAIDLACQVAETDVKKTIFGFPQSWIVNEELLPEYDDLINNLAKSLDLEAVAYVSIPHAISYYLQYLHKTAPTAILIGTSREGAYISYVENGKIKETTSVGWSGGSLGKNIDAGLLKFKTLTQFPASICLYGFGDLTSARNDLAKYNWTAGDRLGAQTAPNFISTPKVIVLEEHVDSLAVSLVGGKDYAKQLGITGKLDIKSLEYSSFNSEALAPIAETTKLTEPEPTLSAVVEKNADTLPFGFTAHTSAITPTIHSEMETPREDIEKEIESTEPDEEVTEDELQEYHHEPTSDHIQEDFVPAQAALNQEEDEEEPWNEAPAKSSKFKGVSTLSSNAKLKKLGIFLIAILVIFGIGGSIAGWAYWNLPKATVTVYVKPDNLEKEVNLTASEKLSLSENTIPAKRLSVDITVSKTANTTGKSTKGTQANGTVTIYNKTTEVKKLNSGTELKTSNGLKFTLSGDVTVASASADINGSINGKQDAKVVASDIGPDSNISKDVSMSVSSFSKSEVEAISADTFSGGTKKDIKTVAAIDKTNLSKDAKADIETQIADKLKEKVSEGEIFMDKAYQVTKALEKFNKNVGDESETLSVDTTESIDGFVVKKSDVEQVLSNVSTASVPDGYELKDNNKEVQTEFVSLSKDGTITLTAVAKAVIIPKINEKEIASSIVGKKEEAARQTILSNTKVLDVSFDYSARLPDFLVTLPHLEKNITVKRGVR